MDQVATFKAIMGNYPTGVTVVTMMDEEGTPLGLTVNSFASVSIDPLLILWSIDKRVSSYEKFVHATHFAVNILAADQGDICTLFATKGTDRFSQCEWSTSEHRLPVLQGVAGVLQCRTFKTVEAGDHLILIGEVIALEDFGKKPLLYHKRKFGPIPSQFYGE